MKKAIAIALFLGVMPALAEEPRVHLVTVHDGRSFAIEAALPKLSKGAEGFALRESWWEGELKEGGIKIVRHQLFERNEYWFWAGLSDTEAKVSIHIYDEAGKLIEAESWKKGNVAGARVLPKKTGSYLIRIKVDKGCGGGALGHRLRLPIVARMA